MDPISDILIRIKNAGAAGKKTVVIPYSKMKMALASLLEKNGYVKAVEKIGKKIKKIIEMEIIYGENKKPLITNVKRISKPSKRIYKTAKEVKALYRRKGVVVVSTSKGLLTSREAGKANLGGEIICRVD